MRSIRSVDSFRSPLRKRKPTRVLDLRRNHFNHIVCSDTGEVCSSYKEYLHSKHWKLFKKRYRQSSYYIGHCLFCDCTVRLHFHHITYVRLGKEFLKDVVTLCKKHHTQIHKALRKGVAWEKIMSNLKAAL